MLTMPVLILLAVIVTGLTACVVITYRAHHSAASLLEQHKAAVRRQAAFPGSAHHPAEPMKPARRRRGRRGLGLVIVGVIAAGAFYLWQSSASAATTAAHPVLTAARAPEQSGTGGWAVLAVVAVIVLAFTFLPRLWTRKNSR